MTNQLLPLLELGANNRVNRPSPDRAIETKDQGFSRAFQDAEQKIAANKADAQAAREARTERQESSAKNNSSTENESADTIKVALADDKKVDPQTPPDKANTDAGENSANVNKRLDADSSTEGNIDDDSDAYLSTDTGDATDRLSLIGSELDAIITPEIQSLLEGLTKQLQSLGDLESLEATIDPVALQQLIDELFVDSSQLPLVEVAETINQAMINQPLTITSATQLLSDLKKFAQLSPATESASSKLSAALTPLAELRSFVVASMSSSSGDLEPGVTGERLEKLTLQISTDKASNSIADKLNLSQLLNSITAASEPSSAKLSTDTSPLQSLANIPLNAAVASGRPQLTVGMPFQQAQWGEAVAERVMWMSSQGLQEAEIHLNPAELGPMQVKVSLVADQAHVSFVVSNASVREALDQSAIRLREMFNGEGLNLVDVDVSDQSQHQASSSDDERNNPQFNGGRGELDVVQGENQLSIHSNGKGMLSLYA
jgi:flagellar hook-length control protein FliK